MSRPKVVFVLGAGASKPYNYPTGAELISNILTPSSEVERVMGELGYSQPQFEPFQDALRKSVQPSIDAFLERRPDHRELGKLLIAANILQREIEGHFETSSDNWYPMLLNKFDDDFDRLNFSDVTIVTFNYDRSLEQFLFQALCNRHNRPCEQVADSLSKLRTVHVYGSLGQLDWQTPWGRKYNSHLSRDEVRKAAEGIKIISEGRDDTDESRKAKECVLAANKIFFLGFGYHNDNMRRIGFPLADRTDKHIYGSAFHLSDAERQVLGAVYGFGHVGRYEEGCVAFLRNTYDFLRL